MPTEKEILQAENTERTNKIIQWVLGAGGAAASITLLLKAISELKDTQRDNKVGEEFETTAQPTRKVNLRSPMLKRQFMSKKKKSTKTKEDETIPTETVTKLAGVGPITGEALKYIAAIFAAGGGIYGANKLFNYFKAKSLKNELKDSEAQYYSALFAKKKMDDELSTQKFKGSGMYRFASEDTSLSEEMEKSASTLTKVLGGGAALALALALGSAYMSREYLNAKNPKFKHFDAYHSRLTSPDFSSPRLSFVVEDENEKDITDDDLQELKEEYGKAKVQTKKKASVVELTDIFSGQIKEMLVKVAAKLEKENLTNGGINQVIDCVALGEIDMLKEATSFDDMCDKAIDFIANTKKIASAANKELAVSYIVNDKILGDVFVPYVCGEILEQNPTFDKLASVVIAPEASDEFASLLTMVNLSEKESAFGQLELAKTANVKELSETLDFDVNFDNDMHNAIYGVLKSQVFA